MSEVANHHLRLNREIRAAIPKIVIIVPETRLIHKSHWAFNFFLKRLMALVSIIHQRVEPENTPRTTAVAEIKFLLALPTPMPAKMAAKERMVSGLVSVKKNVEVKAPI